MSICKCKFIAACAGLLMCGWVGAGEEPVLSIGNCVSQLAETRPLAAKICRAKIRRSVMKPGNTICVGGGRVVGGNIHCSRRDSAANTPGAVWQFEPYYARLNAPVSIGSIETFYADRHAGDANRRFQVSGQSDGSLEIEESSASSGNRKGCAFAVGSSRCTVSAGFSAGLRQTRYTRDYVLRLDGLLVEEQSQERQCQQCTGERCRNGGSWRCPYYTTTPPVTELRLYSWD